MFSHVFPFERLSLQVLVDGQFPAVEDHIRSVFKTAIGADSVGESAAIKEGVSFNNYKGVFQAAITIGDQAGLWNTNITYVNLWFSSVYLGEFNT